MTIWSNPNPSCLFSLEDSRDRRAGAQRSSVCVCVCRWQECWQEHQQWAHFNPSRPGLTFCVIPFEQALQQALWCLVSLCSITKGSNKWITTQFISAALPRQLEWTNISHLSQTHGARSRIRTWQIQQSVDVNCVMETSSILGNTAWLFVCLPCTVSIWLRVALKGRSSTTHTQQKDHNVGLCSSSTWRHQKWLNSHSKH